MDGTIRSERAEVVLEAARSLLATGRVRITGVWPRAVEATVDDGAWNWPVRFNPRRGWQCMCGEPECAHQVAVALVAQPRCV
jgi:hypothetical protein